MPLPCADAETLTELRAMPISMLASDDWPNLLARHGWPPEAAEAGLAHEEAQVPSSRAIVHGRHLLRSHHCHVARWEGVVLPWDLPERPGSPACQERG